MVAHRTVPKPDHKVVDSANVLADAGVGAARGTPAGAELAFERSASAGPVYALLGQRSFLKALGAAIGGAFVGRAVKPEAVAHASYTTNSLGDTVSGDLVVQGSLSVSGDVHVNGVRAIDSLGRAVQAYYAPAVATPPTPTPTATNVVTGTWTQVATYTWATIGTKTWGDVMSLPPA